MSVPISERAFPYEDQALGLAAIRRSARIRVTQVSDTEFLDRAPASTPTISFERPTKNGITSATSGQKLQMSSQSSSSDPPYASEETVEPRRSGRKESSRKRRRPAGSAASPPSEAVDYIMSPVTVEDRARWKGWCEVESEPAFFNVMLREFEVQGIKVQEVVSLDEEMLGLLPKPLYGLIFLFQFRDDGHSNQEASCPDHIWFANQTTSNACASIALLNIVMNIEGIELGPTLESLKAFTTEMDPAICGYIVSNHDYIRQIHNSFSRKMDMLQADLALSNEANAKRSKQKASNRDEDEAGFHFIAFVPIHGCVWKLDGLERQPTSLGKFEDDWMTIARPMLDKRMQQYEGDQIQFNLLSLCKSPLLTISEELAVNVRTLSTVEEFLCRFQPDWQKFLGELESEDALRGQSDDYKVTQQLLDVAEVPQKFMNRLSSPEINAEKLFEMRQELIASQNSLRAAIIEEMVSIEQDNEKARSRRHDYAPMIYTWLSLLAGNRTLQGLVEATEVG